jgi:hypothetical protein
MRQVIGAGLILALCATGLACTSSPAVRYQQQAGPGKSQGHGPPPHAPAHGYRAKTQDGLELVYRADIGVYEFVGRDQYYYKNGVIYHKDSIGWIMGRSVDGPWTSVSEAQIPPGLRSDHPGKGHGQGKAKIKGHSD